MNNLIKFYLKSMIIIEFQRYNLKKIIKKFLKIKKFYIINFNKIKNFTKFWRLFKNKNKILKKLKYFKKNNVIKTRFF